MATKKEEVEQENTLPAVFGENGGAITNVDDSELDGLDGMGYSEKQEDGLVPILAILQDMSAEVKRQHSKYIPDSKPGDMIIRSLGLVIDAEKETVVVQPCGFAHVYVEWNGEPGDGVPVGRYPFDERPVEAKEKKVDSDDPDDNRTEWVMPNGNRLVDTREHYVRLFLRGAWMPLVIPMGGSNHKVSRGWTQKMKMFTTPSGAKAPAWFRGYKLTTKFQQRGQQSWFNYDLSDVGWVKDAAARAEGREMFEAVSSETITADLETGAETSSGDEDAPI